MFFSLSDYLNAPDCGFCGMDWEHCRCGACERCGAPEKECKCKEEAA